MMTHEAGHEKRDVCDVISFDDRFPSMSLMQGMRRQVFHLLQKLKLLTPQPFGRDGTFD